MSVPRCILVVDDDPQTPGYLPEMIRRCGFEVDYLDTFAAAFDRLAQRTYDGLVVEHQVGEECGECLVEWLRRHGRAEPVIMMSALASEGLWIEMMNKGAADLLAKPVQPGPLKQALQHVRRKSLWPVELAASRRAQN